MPRPIAAHRQNEILARASVSGSVSVEELADRFDVSRETIRRDLKTLAGRGLLDVVHGGALRRETGEAPFEERRRENAAGKAAIAKAAAAMVEDGMVLLLDSGTTTHAISLALAGGEVRDLTICTTSLMNAQILCRAGMRVTMLGGEIDRNDESSVGIDVIAAILRYRVDLAFVGVGGMSPEGEPTDFTRAGAEQRAAMLDAAHRGYIVADRTKFSLASPLRIQPRKPVAGLITDAAPSLALKRLYKERRIAVILPSGA